MKVAIIGAGIAGLTAAIALSQKGIQCIIFEQAAELKEFGAGLQISPNGSKVLNYLGVNVQHKFVPETITMCRGKSNKTVFSIPMKSIASHRWGAQFFQVYRPDLHRALISKTSELGIEIRLGEKISTDQLNVLKHSYDYVIAADGVHSLARSSLSKAPAHFSGNIAYRAIVPLHELENPPPPSGVIWAGNAQHAVTTLIHSGKLVNFVGICQEAEWDKDGWNHPAQRSDVLHRFEGWHPTITEIIQKAPIINRWALLYHPELHSFHQDNMVLIGDAAHPMLPSLAQGAVQAMEDAFILAECLVHGSLADFGHLRCNRVARVQKESRQNLERFHLNGLKRNAFYTAASLANRFQPKLLQRRFDWLYGYDVKSAAQLYFSTLPSKAAQLH